MPLQLRTAKNTVTPVTPVTITPSLDEPRILQVSNSSLALLSKTCARKFQFQKLYQASRSSDSLPGDVGNALHRTYYTWLETGSRQQAAWTLLTNYPHKYQTSAFNNRSVEACWATALNMFNAPVMENFDIAQIETVNSDGKKELRPAFEVPFRIVLLNRDGEPLTWRDAKGQLWQIEYVGYIDIILFDYTKQEYVIKDIKTTTRDYADYTPVFFYDPQCLPYALIVEQFTGQHINSLRIRYFVNYIDMVAPRAEAYEFVKSRRDIEDWALNLSIELTKLKTYMQIGHFPRTADCYSYNRLCEYWQICDIDNEESLEESLRMRAEHDKAMGIEPRPEFVPWLQTELQLGNL